MKLYSIEEKKIGSINIIKKVFTSLRFAMNKKEIVKLKEACSAI